MKTEIATPRTDAAVKAAEDMPTNSMKFTSLIQDMKQIERELAEAKEAEASETRWAAQYKAERDRLGDALRDLIEMNLRNNLCDPDMQPTEEGQYRLWHKADAALAAVKGGEA